MYNAAAATSGHPVVVAPKHYIVLSGVALVVAHWLRKGRLGSWLMVNLAPVWWMEHCRVFTRHLLFPRPCAAPS